MSHQRCFFFFFLFFFLFFGLVSCKILCHTQIPQLFIVERIVSVFVCRLVLFLDCWRGEGKVRLRLPGPGADVLALNSYSLTRIELVLVTYVVPCCDWWAA